MLIALIAVLAGRSAVIASNEASASHGNATWHGIDVNHQWSKSLEFERLFGKWLDRDRNGGPEYFSLLRPLSELRIVKAAGDFGIALEQREQRFLAV